MRALAPVADLTGGAAAASTGVGSATPATAAVMRRRPRVVVCEAYFLLKAAQLDYPHGTRGGQLGGRSAVVGRAVGAVGVVVECAAYARAQPSCGVYAWFGPIFLG